MALENNYDINFMKWKWPDRGQGASKAYLSVLLEINYKIFCKKDFFKDKKNLKDLKNDYIVIVFYPWKYPHYYYFYDKDNIFLF